MASRSFALRPSQGRQMQVDFVVFERCGVRQPAFVATLGYSRMSFVRFVEPDVAKACEAVRARGG